MSKGLDLDHGLCFVGPDLGLNCLQRFSTDMIKLADMLPGSKLYIPDDDIHFYYFLT